MGCARGDFSNAPNTAEVLSLDTVGSFAKVAYVRDWIQLDIYKGVT